jgi:hypothetical protein
LSGSLSFPWERWRFSAGVPFFYFHDLFHDREFLRPAIHAEIQHGDEGIRIFVKNRHKWRIYKASRGFLSVFSAFLESAICAGSVIPDATS